jgi:hypothetical protein
VELDWVSLPREERMLAGSGETVTDFEATGFVMWMDGEEIWWIMR